MRRGFHLLLADGLWPSPFLTNSFLWWENVWTLTAFPLINLRLFTSEKQFRFHITFETSGIRCFYRGISVFFFDTLCKDYSQLNEALQLHRLKVNPRPELHHFVLKILFHLFISGKKLQLKKKLFFSNSFITLSPASLRLKHYLQGKSANRSCERGPRKSPLNLGLESTLGKALLGDNDLSSAAFRLSAH